MTSNYFYQIDEPYTNIKSVKQSISNASWQWIPYMTVADNFFESLSFDPFIKEIATQFGGHLKLYKVPSNYVYHWHKDANIGCSLNMVLEEYNSHTLFIHPERDNKYVEPFVELKYKPETWYIFNSQERHTVINLDKRDRILFTLIMPKQTNYHDVVAWYKEYSKK
jgi:hypothetical protein